MPRLPRVVGFDWNLDDPGSRFTRVPAIAIGVPEEENEPPESSIRRHIGDWVLDEQDELGQGEVVRSSVGRGASGAAAAVEWIALHAGGGIVSYAAVQAFKALVARARERLQRGDRPGVFVSRGGAAFLAAAEVDERFGDRDPLEIEAVEEPSSIEGRDVSELSYVGIEPWIVLLRNREAERRYIVLVASDGEILAAIETPLGEFETLFLPAPEDSQWSQPLPPERNEKRS